MGASRNAEEDKPKQEGEAFHCLGNGQAFFASSFLCMIRRRILETPQHEVDCAVHLARASRTGEGKA